jgi:hypothetical protein
MEVGHDIQRQMPQKKSSGVKTHSNKITSSLLAQISNMNVMQQTKKQKMS